LRGLCTRTPASIVREICEFSRTNPQLNARKSRPGRRLFALIPFIALLQAHRLGVAIEAVPTPQAFQQASL